MRDIQAGVYQHIKGGYYLVLGVARQERPDIETDELVVVYVSLDVTKSGPRLCTRPVDDFFATVSRDATGKTILDACGQPRFQYIGVGLP